MQIFLCTSLYADDIILLKSLCNVHDVSAVNRDLDWIVKWSQQWRMTFNATKTVYVIVYGKPRSSES